MTRTTRVGFHRRQFVRAAISRGLIIALAVVALGAGGFWAMRMKGDDVGGAGQAEVTFYCPDCKEVKVSTADLKNDKIPFKGGKLQCPKCKKFSASPDKPSSVKGVANP